MGLWVGERFFSFLGWVGLFLGWVGVSLGPWGVDWGSGVFFLSLRVFSCCFLAFWEFASLGFVGFFAAKTIKLFFLVITLFYPWYIRTYTLIV